MQNRLFAAIMTALLVLLMAGSAMCATTDVTVSIGDGEGNVTIPIKVENVTDLGACHILLKYNNSVVSVTNVTGGDMDIVYPNFKSDTGTVVIGAHQTNNPGINGTVIVANVTFTPVDVCLNTTSSLILEVNTLKNATSGGMITHDTDDGVYTSAYAGGFNGDASGDEVVDMYDAMYIAKYVLEITGYDIVCPAIADVNGDGNVTIDDAAYLANYLVENPEYDPLK